MTTVFHIQCGPKLVRQIKKIVTLYFVCTISGTLITFGQNFKSIIGFKLLPGLTDAYDSNELEYFQPRIHPRLTFNFGGQFILPIKDSICFIETGLYYTDRGGLQKGFVSIYSYGQGNYTKTSDIYVHTYYISLPILFRMKIKHFFISIGPTFDRYLYTKWVWTPEVDTIEKSNWRPKGFRYRYQIGATLNLGTQIKITDRLGLFIEGNFNPSDFLRVPFYKNFYFYWNYLLGTGLTLKL